MLFPPERNNENGEVHVKWEIDQSGTVPLTFTVHLVSNENENSGKCPEFWVDRDAALDPARKRMRKSRSNGVGVAYA